MNYALSAARLLGTAALSLAAIAHSRPLASPVLSDPSSGPTARAAVATAEDAFHPAAIRRHGWRLWTDLTAPAPTGLPIWQTWPESREIFRKPPNTQAAYTQPTGALPMVAWQGSREGSNSPDDNARPAAGTASGADADRDAEARVIVRRPFAAVTVHFNPAAAHHIAANRLASPATFEGLKQELDESGASPARRSIAEFPRDAVAIKAVWRVLPRVPAPGEVWVLPVWDPAPRSAAIAYPPAQWSRSVVLDLSGDDLASGSPREVRIPGQRQPCRVVSINRFYRIDLSSDQAAAMNASEGDQAILVGLHIATKERPDWVWATYWWHDDPHAGEFAAGKPDPATFSNPVWSNYLMDIDFGDAPQPPGTERRPIFNPWLEAGMKRGIGSNCVSCHQQAALTSELHTAPFTVRRNLLPHTDPRFSGGVRTDFVWSVAREAAAP